MKGEGEGSRSDRYTEREDREREREEREGIREQRDQGELPRGLLHPQCVADIQRVGIGLVCLFVSLKGF